MAGRYIIALALVAVGTLLPSLSLAQEIPWTGQTVLVTGANRGLGLELARQLHEAGATVIGTARRPAEAEELKDLGVRVIKLDVADAVSVAALAQRLDKLELDVLINNAGIFPERGGFASADPDEVLRVYAVNTVGPLRVTQALLPALRRGEHKLIMNMSSGLGSIADNGRGSSVGYRSSKAALNMQTRTLAMELQDEGFICIVMSPGWVRTDMGGERAPLSATESVRGMLETMASLGPEQTGEYFNHDGQQLPW